MNQNYFKPFVIWFISFFGFFALNKILPPLPSYISFFITATVLSFISFYFVISCAELNLNRTTYLIIGLVSIVLLLVVSKPLIYRAASINKLSNLSASNVLIASLLSHTTSIITPQSLVYIRNEIYSNIYDTLANLVSEPLLYIFTISLIQILLASSIGLWIGNGIDKSSHLLAVALVATIADIWSVFQGATYYIVRSTAIYYFLLRFPLLFSDTVSFPFLIGLSDFIFFAIYYQSAVRFELGVVKNFIILSVGFIVTIFFAIFFRTGLPVLPFISLLFLVFNYKQLNIQSKDLSFISLFLILVALVFILTTILLR